MNDTAQYDVVEIPGSTCVDCGRGARFRVVDRRKKHGERYPGSLRCKPCARNWAALMNAEISQKRQNTP